MTIIGPVNVLVSGQMTMMTMMTAFHVLLCEVDMASLAVRFSNVTSSPVSRRAGLVA
jgi:hypothetical protein